MVCIKNNLKVYTQQLNLGSIDKFRESVKLHIHDPGSVFRSGFKTFKKENEVEDGEVEFGITLRKEELLNHDNCTWLSIGDASFPSSWYEDNGLSCYMDVKIDAWFISLLSTQSPTSGTLLNTKTTFFDGSRVNPMEEASLILDQRKLSDKDMVFQENLEEEEVVSSLSWLENESSDSYQEQSYGQSLVKKSKLAYDDSSDEHSLFSSSSTSDYSSKLMDLEGISADEPLFWPFNSASDWSSEISSPKSRNMVAAEVNCLTKKYDRKHKIVLEDLLLVDKLNIEGVIIEQVLGLSEFDGHEGVESEFDKDHFSII